MQNMNRRKGKLFIIVGAIGFIALLCFICFGKCASRLGYHDFEVGGKYYEAYHEADEAYEVLDDDYYEEYDDDSDKIEDTACKVH